MTQYESELIKYNIYFMINFDWIEWSGACPLIEIVCEISKKCLFSEKKYFYGQIFEKKKHAKTHKNLIPVDRKK
jgi:hypothetical protein